jgi:hypothetical protein
MEALRLEVPVQHDLGLHEALGLVAVVAARDLALVGGVVGRQVVDRSRRASTRSR